MIVLLEIATIFAITKANISKSKRMEPSKTLASLLAPGDIGTIANRLELSHSATAAAIRRGNPGHPAVREALRMAEESGALAAAQQLAKLTPLAQAA